MYVVVASQISPGMYCSQNRLALNHIDVLFTYPIMFYKIWFPGKMGMRGSSSTATNMLSSSVLLHTLLQQPRS